RFIADPFDPSGAGRCFRTGDFVRLAPNGGLVYLGRRDQQAKIRGFRVELGEIEAALSLHPGVRTAAAIVQGADLARARVKAFAAPVDGVELAERELIAHCQRILPAYMVPGSVSVLPELPRLPNGKLDRARLAAMAQASGSPGRVGIEPRNAVEAK